MSVKEAAAATAIIGGMGGAGLIYSYGFGVGTSIDMKVLTDEKYGDQTLGIYGCSNVIFGGDIEFENKNAESGAAVTNSEQNTPITPDRGCLLYDVARSGKDEGESNKVASKFELAASKDKDGIIITTSFSNIFKDNTTGKPHLVGRVLILKKKKKDQNQGSKDKWIVERGLEFTGASLVDLSKKLSVDISGQTHSPKMTLGKLCSSGGTCKTFDSMNAKYWKGHFEWENNAKLNSATPMVEGVVIKEGDDESEKKKGILLGYDLKNSSSSTLTATRAYVEGKGWVSSTDKSKWQFPIKGDEKGGWKRISEYSSRIESETNSPSQAS